METSKTGQSHMAGVGLVWEGGSVGEAGSGV